MRKSRRTSCLIAMLVCLFVPDPSLAQVRVGGYSNIVIQDADNDPYHIGIELRTQAQGLGFKVYLSAREVPTAEHDKTCVAAWKWNTEGSSGSIHVRIFDLLSRTMIVEGEGSATNWLSLKAAVERGVSNVWKRIGYRGYTEQEHLSNIQFLFPSRPKVDFDEKAFRTTKPTSEIEGIWADSHGQYTLAIIKPDQVTDFNYLGIVLTSNNSLWSRGEIKIEIRKTAVPTAYIGNYYPSDKKRQGTTFIVDSGALLKFTMARPDGKQEEMLFVKSWPIREAGSKEPSFSPGSVTAGSGTAFLVSIDGLVATNWHVVKDASDIRVFFPWETEGLKAKIAIKDPANDLVILMLVDYDRGKSGCTDLPYEITRASATKLGTRISTIGYPLDGVLGSGPKYSEGVVSGLTGIRDDPRTLQISAAIQPGSSGSPLFNENGDVIGVVVSTLNATFLYSVAEAIPQNVNFAIKADYLLSLLDMLPEKPKLAVRKQAGATEAGRCIGVVRTVSRGPQ